MGTLGDKFKEGFEPEFTVEVKGLEGSLHLTVVSLLKKALERSEMYDTLANNNQTVIFARRKK